MAKREKRQFLIERKDDASGDWKPFGKPEAEWETTADVLRDLRTTKAEGEFRVIQVCAVRKQTIETDVRVVVTEG